MNPGIGESGPVQKGNLCKDGLWGHNALKETFSSHYTFEMRCERHCRVHVTVTTAVKVRYTGESTLP